MYRSSRDAELVGDIVAQQAANNIAGMISAARELWRHPHEISDEADDWESEAWRAIVIAGAVPEAVEAGVRLAQARDRIRFCAFVHIVQ